VYLNVQKTSVLVSLSNQGAIDVLQNWPIWQQGSISSKLLRRTKKFCAIRWTFFASFLLLKLDELFKTFFVQLYLEIYVCNIVIIFTIKVGQKLNDKTDFLRNRALDQQRKW
jgi:hypothetical protein